MLYDQVLREALTPKDAASPTPKNDNELEKGSGTQAEFWYPVQCSSCALEIAVLDQDEVYHFFNVLAS